MAAPGAPAGRYGAAMSRTRRRWIYWSLLTAFILAGCVVAYFYYENFGADPIDAEVSTYQVVNDHQIDVTFTVTRDHPNQAADCIIDAPAADGSEAGRREVYVPAGGNVGTLSTELQTDERATTAEFYGCSYQVPAYLTKSMPPSG
ncbi:MAG TPA: DUF4307 domain-containing protein [Pseudonocardiaceae bacterium]|jgi:hypothetical protein|nr:DUF4307 domain-containing protein [Pseudonocardiaceae bacterium]